MKYLCVQCKAACSFHTPPANLNCLLCQFPLVDHGTMKVDLRLLADGTPTCWTYYSHHGESRAVNLPPRLEMRSFGSRLPQPKKFCIIVGTDEADETWLLDYDEKRADPLDVYMQALRVCRVAKMEAWERVGNSLFRLSLHEMMLTRQRVGVGAS